MTPLADILRGQVAASGPLTVAQYMAACLLHPEHGYYTTRQPLGAEGDFTTAPEISQMFGELVGLCLAQAWLDQGAPAPFVLAELGPGRGTLMADILRATARVPGFHAAARIALVEASPVLRAAQRQTLGGTDISWHDDAATLPEGPLFVVANEFFDALPIRQFVRQGAGWAERMITWNGDGFAFGLSPASARAELAHRLEDTAEGDLVETCAPGRAVAETLAARIAGAGLQDPRKTIWPADGITALEEAQQRAGALPRGAQRVLDEKAAAPREGIVGRADRQAADAALGEHGPT